jgi:hypothetical protein
MTAIGILRGRGGFSAFFKDESHVQEFTFIE